MSSSVISATTGHGATANEAAGDVRLEAVNLECTRGERLLFSGLNLSLRPGNLIHVAGPNGSGKTSLLRILCGLMSPSKGEVRWCSQPLHKVRPEFMAEMAYLGHTPGIKGDLTPYENLKIARALGRANEGISLTEALCAMRLEEFEELPARMLSAGQKRRVALARLLVTRATLWILDEPFTALDSSGIAIVEELLSEHVLRGGMVVLTTHQALSLQCSRIERIELTP